MNKIQKSKLPKPVLQHEGTLCTRKYGNPKAPTFGIGRRKTEFEQNARTLRHVPGPGSYTENHLRKSISPRLDTTEPRMKLLVNKEPGPGHYYNETMHG